MRAGTRSRQRWIIVGLAAAGALIATIMWHSTEPAAAQARPVLVDVVTEPELPEPGDNVRVRVSLQGCPPGPAAVEVYLETNDGVSRTTELMARQPARSSMLWTSRALLELPDAVAGWYGVRVVCGTFRPPREPLANTRFVVGAKPTARANVLSDTVVSGGSIGVVGNGCTGGAADAQLVPTAEAIEPYEPDVEVAVRPDGTWSIPLPVAEGTRPGRVSVRARCLATNQFGRRIALPYADWIVVTVTPG